VDQSIRVKFTTSISVLTPRSRSLSYT